MSDKIESIIKKAYRDWKSGMPSSQTGGHLSEEELACFLERRLSAAQEERTISHLLGCSDCIQLLSLILGSWQEFDEEVPVAAKERIKETLGLTQARSPLEIAARIKGDIIELLSTTGDILVGLELVSASLLRSRNIEHFKDEITILKNFDFFRVEIKIENKKDGRFAVSVEARNKKTCRIIKNLRFTLKRGEVELESYLAETGKAIFDNVLFGAYAIEVSSPERRLALISLDITQ